ncbi:MAG: hypothetical protein DHS20C18_43860 [Saprospiraceae bacterium]|nr:MAG: hypothetical protein DHS20C18_43860 [Saprospiraceae bacterium]
MKKWILISCCLIWTTAMHAQHIIDLLNCDQDISLNGDIRMISHKKINLYPNTGFSTWELVFNQQNQLVREKAVEQAAELRHHYNEQGQLEATVRLVKGLKQDSTAFLYDDARKLFQKVSFGNFSSPQTTYQFTYDSLDRVIMLAAKDQNNQFTQTVEYLDSTHQVIVTHSQGERSRRLLLPFDTETQCINRILREIKNVHGQITVQEVANLSSSNNIDGSSILHEYQYDEMGNWTWHRQSNFLNGIKTPTTLWIRKIKYR